MPKRRLHDLAVRYQVLLERLKQHEVQDFAKVFNQLDRATRDILLGLAVEDLGKLTRKELNKVLAELRQTNLDLLTKAVEQFDENLAKIAAHSADFEVQTLRSVTETKRLKIVAIADAAAYQEAVAQPISATGQLLETFSAEWTKGEVNRLNNVVQRAWGEGWTINQLAQAIRGTKKLNYKDGILATSRRNAEAIGRTAIQHTASSGRIAVWSANRDIVSGYIWVSTLDSRTTQICRSLDRRRFDLGAGPRPPAHINCRSTTIAEVNKDLGLDFLDEGATRGSKFGEVDADLSYYDWLKQQPAAFQDEAIGKTRGALFRNGGLSADQFAALNLGRNFQPLTLDEMRKLAPVAFEKAGIPPKG